jgi:hypothetical protein
VEKLHVLRENVLVEEVQYVQDGRVVDMWMSPMRAGATSETDLGIIFNDRAMDFVANVQTFRDVGFQEPARGDRIIRDVHGERVEHEVIGDGSEPPARWTDRYHLAWRIHTEILNREEVNLLDPCPACFKLGAVLGEVVVETIP